MGNFENNNETVIHINGFLEALATINTFANDGKTYYIALLNKINNNYQDTIRKHLNVKHWNIKAKKIDLNWKGIFKADLFDYFNQNKTISCESIEILFEVFFEKIEKIILYPCELYKVTVDWSMKDDDYEGFFECYSNDYLFDLGEQILYLHFGSSD